MRFALITTVCLLFAASTAFAGDGPLQAPGAKGVSQKYALQKGMGSCQKGMRPLQKPGQKAYGHVQKPCQKPYQK